MTTAAILTMIIVQVGVTLITAYFFRKVLKKPPASVSDESDKGSP